MTIPLSVLDLFPVSTGMTPSAAIRESVAFARRVDDLGYTRYWIAEHHNMPSIASSAPEILIGHVAARTRRIRVGAGGMMLPNHAPLHVLEVFRTLEALHPGRIDLGIGRAPGTDPITSVALRRGDEDGVNEQLGELFAFARGRFPKGHPFAQIDAMPDDVPVPPIWMLGSTTAGASIAAQLGLRYAFAGHFSMKHAADAVRTYREGWQPSADLARPYLIMAVTVVCGETDAHAQDLAGPHRVAVARLATGARGPLPTVEEARGARFSPQEEALIERFTRGAIVGDVATVTTGLRKLAAETTADELMISTLVADPRDRVASYERVAAGWGLTPAGP